MWPFPSKTKVAVKNQAFRVFVRLGEAKRTAHPDLFLQNSENFDLETAKSWIAEFKQVEARLNDYVLADRPDTSSRRASLDSLLLLHPWLSRRTASRAWDDVCLWIDGRM